MRRITTASREPLYNTLTTRQIEARAQAGLPLHTLMDRAGLAVARLAAALGPHADRIWVACGPGNNGGDGMRAATHLAQWARQGHGGWQVHLTHVMGPTPDPARLAPDSRYALGQALAAGVHFHADPPDRADLVIDALLGIGARRAPEGRIGHWLERMNVVATSVLAVDVPSGLDADSGAWSGPALSTDGPTRHTLSLLTLKTGLFTADGRDATGSLWFDDLGVSLSDTETPRAWLSPANAGPARRLHRAHKGTQGDVIIIGGQPVGTLGTGMTGAAVLAARAALTSGAGRVYLGLLGDSIAWDPVYPELMVRSPEQLLASPSLEAGTVVCGCGGGQAVIGLLPTVIGRSHRLVLDADGLNAMAADSGLGHQLRTRHERGLTTVITPHPLEAARLLGTDTTTVMTDRLGAAETLAERLGAICVLKGSGTVIAAPGQTPFINASGNARLATAGTGDVLAGMLGAALAGNDSSHTLECVRATVARHGDLADRWKGHTLTAGMLAQGSVS